MSYALSGPGYQRRIISVTLNFRLAGDWSGVDFKAALADLPVFQQCDRGLEEIVPWYAHFRTLLVS